MRRLVVFVVVVMGVLAAGSLAEAQLGSAVIRGTVTDAQGGVLPGVSIVVTHVDTDARDGSY